MGEERVQLDPEGGWGVWRGRQGGWECGWQRQCTSVCTGNTESTDLQERCGSE